MRILYAGESLLSGSANYLYGALQACGTMVDHVEASTRLSRHHLRTRYDVVILSDFPRANMSRAAEEAIVAQVTRGSGLLMVGGWASFSAPLGQWRGSLIEELLPVTCAARDDRKHTPTGALIVPRVAHPILGTLSFAHPPAVCGFNVLHPKRKSIVVLEAQPIASTGYGPGARYGVRLVTRRYPLLVVYRETRQRTAAFATDLAPHWCGGLVDWGTRRRSLRVRGATRIEVGHQYVELIASMTRWLAGGT